MKNKHLHTIIILILFAGFISYPLYSQNEEMKNKAKERMGAWSESITQQQYEKLGYKNREEFVQTELGDPYNVFTIHPEKLLKYDTSLNFRELLTESGNMIFPVLSEGRNTSLLWMVKKDGEWYVGRIGSSELSKNLKGNEEAIEKSREQLDIPAGESPQFVRLYQLYLDFFYIEGKETAYIVPMQTIPGLDIKGKTFYSVNDILPILQEELRKKMPFTDAEGRIIEY